MKTRQKVLNQEHVKKAMKIMYPYPLWEDADAEQALNQLDCYDSFFVEALVKTAPSEEMLWKLVEDTAHEVLLTYESLGEKTHQIHWGETKQKIIKEVRTKYYAWFMEAEQEKERRTYIRKANEKIRQVLARAKRGTSALISTEKEADARKKEIKRTFEHLTEEFLLNEKGIREDDLQLLLKKVDEALNEAYAFVDWKLTEKPVHLLYYRTGNRVAVKVNLQTGGGYRYTQGRGKEVRFNRGKDQKEFPLIVSVSYIMDFLYTNNVRDEDLYIDPRSVDQFYGFDNVISVNLTPSFIREYFNRDALRLVRYTPNKKRYTNMMGMPICHFATVLIESDWQNDYIDKDMTDEEADKICGLYPHTRIAREIRNMQQARKLEQSGKLKQLQKEVEAYDQKIQQMIDNHKTEIFTRLHEKLKHISRLKTGTDGAVTIDIDENGFAFDCGFIYVYTTDREYSQKRNILANAKSSVSRSMNVRLPYPTQSVTIQRAVFDIVQDIVKREAGIELYARTQLD